MCGRFLYSHRVCFVDFFDLNSKFQVRSSQLYFEETPRQLWGNLFNNSDKLFSKNKINLFY